MAKLDKIDSLHKIGADAIEAVMAAQKEDTTMTDTLTLEQIDNLRDNFGIDYLPSVPQFAALCTLAKRGLEADALAQRVEKLEKALGALIGSAGKLVSGNYVLGERDLDNARQALET